MKCNTSESIPRITEDGNTDGYDTEGIWNVCIIGHDIDCKSRDVMLEPI